jgi:hypothetical protein
LPQADHFGRDVLIADETLRDGSIPVCFPGPAVTRRSATDLNALNLLATDHTGERVRGGAVTGTTALRTIDTAKPDLDVLGLGLYPNVSPSMTLIAVPR